LEVLRGIVDPEVGINIVDLGLVWSGVGTALAILTFAAGVIWGAAKARRQIP